MIEAVKLMCAKCNKPVDAFEVITYARYVDYIARCHGDEQRVRIGVMELARADGISFGRAFDAPQLEKE